jgi:TusA-related sulfurtransferase
MTLQEAANLVIELEQEVQEATIDATGDVCDPGPMAALSAALSVLADGDTESAAQMFVDLQKWLRDEELELLR